MATELTVVFCFAYLMFKMLPSVFDFFTTDWDAAATGGLSRDVR